MYRKVDLNIERTLLSWCSATTGSTPAAIPSEVQTVAAGLIAGIEEAGLGE